MSEAVTEPAAHAGDAAAGGEPGDEVRGLTHVGAVSFLASRLAPGGQFWLALAGGVALARAAALHGLRVGYGASLAAMLETVALIGPARVQGPLTQALSAPAAGRLIARGASRATQFAAVLAIRLAHYTVINVLFVWLIVGGLDEFVHTYDKTVGWLGLPTGQGWAIGVTVVGGLAFGCFYSAVQVLAYGRALRRWPQASDAALAAPPGERASAPPPRVPRPALVAVLLAGVATVAMIVSLTWVTLAAVGAGLVVALVVWRVRDFEALRVGLALGAALGVSAIFPVLIGAVDAQAGSQRAVRAVLIVLVATWARAAAGTEGVRAVAAAALRRLRRVPAASEGAELIAVMDSDRRLAEAARELNEALKDVPTRPLPVADAVTTWVVAEAARGGSASATP